MYVNMYMCLCVSHNDSADERVHLLWFDEVILLRHTLL